MTAIVPFKIDRNNASNIYSRRASIPIPIRHSRAIDATRNGKAVFTTLLITLWHFICRRTGDGQTQTWMGITVK